MESGHGWVKNGKKWMDVLCTRPTVLTKTAKNLIKCQVCCTKSRSGTVFFRVVMKELKIGKRNSPYMSKFLPMTRNLYSGGWGMDLDKGHKKFVMLL